MMIPKCRLLMLIFACLKNLEKKTVVSWQIVLKQEMYVSWHVLERETLQKAVVN